MNIGKAIKILLEKKGITQKELAARTQLTQTTISLLINGETQPRKETLELVAKSLDVTPEILYLLSINKDDVPEDRKQVYDLVWPQIESTIVNLFVK